MSAFFSGAEVALFSLDKKQINELNSKKSFLGNYILTLINEPRRLLVTILLGNTIFNVGATIISVRIALAFAEKYADILLGFGLFHSHTLADNEEAKKNRERTIKVIESEKGSFINQFIPSLYAKENQERLKAEINHQIEMANKMNPKGITAALAGMKERSMQLDTLIFSKVPVLFILGKQDSRIPLEKAMAQASTASVSQINIFANAGHMSWQEEPEKTTAALCGFMGLCLA